MRKGKGERNERTEQANGLGAIGHIEREKECKTKAEKLLHDLNLNFQSCKLNIKAGEDLLPRVFPS